MIVEFEGDVFRWDARSDSEWYFVALPPELSDDIRETQVFRRGFGGVRVEVEIGSSRWRTSIFPQTGGSYVLPLKRAVRDAEGIDPGAVITVRVAILGA